jgi:hypothetical protein
MSLPESIQRQLDEAEAIEALMAGEPETVEEVQEPEEPETIEAPEPEKQEVPATPTPVENWEQKYKTLEGKYNSQVPKLQQELVGTKTQLQSLTEDLEKLKQKPVEPEQKSREAADDEELVGTDIVKAAERAADRRAAKLEAKLDAIAEENAALKQRLGQVSETQSSFAGQDFFSKLAVTVPDWEALQATDQGQQFLNSRMPGTQFSWDEALKTAAGSMDVDRTAEIFGEMVARNPELRPAPGKNNKAELAKQVAPNKSRASAPVDGSKKVWTTQEVSAGWDSINKRVVKGAEAEKLAEELEAAMTENRIR